MAETTHLDAVAREVLYAFQINKEKWRAKSKDYDCGDGGVVVVEKSGSSSKDIQQMMSRRLDWRVGKKLVDAVLEGREGVDKEDERVLMYLTEKVVSGVEARVVSDLDHHDMWECSSGEEEEEEVKLCQISKTKKGEERRREYGGNGCGAVKGVVEDGWTIKAVGGEDDGGRDTPQQAEASYGPLGNGVRSMSTSNIGNTVGKHSGNTVEKYSDQGQNTQDAWNAFENLSLQHSARSMNARANSEWLNSPRISARTLSLRHATQKLIGPVVPGSTLVALTKREKELCLASFEAKGYRNKGGMPIRDAIDMYHKLNTRHVNFSKVWGLVDPETVCMIDEKAFCAFIAITQSIADQGESVILPKKLDSTDISKLILDLPQPGSGSMVDYSTNAIQALHSDTSLPTLRLDKLKDTLQRRGEGPLVYDATFDDLETPRTYCDPISEEESDDGCSTVAASVVSRVPSIARSFKSMSFSLKNLIRQAIKQQERPLKDESLHIPKLPSRVRASSYKIDRAAWEAEVGSGHDVLQLSLKHVALGTTRDFDHPYVSTTLRDSMGRLVEMPIDSHPGTLHRQHGTLVLGDQKFTLATQLGNMPPGCALFFEIKQWKPAKGKMSTVAWTFVDAEMMSTFTSIILRCA